MICPNCGIECPTHEDAELERLKMDVTRYRTMCIAAARELQKLDAPSSNLLDRLSGKLPADIYPRHATAGEIGSI